MTLMDPLELRVIAFIDDTSRLMQLPSQYRQEYEIHFRTHLQLIEAEGENYLDILPEIIGAYERTIVAAQQQTPDELYGELEGHAALLASVFAAREQALKNPILRKAIVKSIPRPKP